MLHIHTSDLTIKAWNRIHALFEYHMFYHSQNNFDSLAYYGMEMTKIREDLTIARDSMMMQQDSNESTNNNMIANMDNKLPYSDVHMFYEDDNILTCNEQQDIELLYMNTLQHHKNNPSLSTVTKDADILSILGLLHSTDIVKLLHPTVQFFASAVSRTFQTTIQIESSKSPIVELQKMLHSALRNLISVRTTNNVSFSLNIENLTIEIIPLLSKPQLQILLHRHYSDTDSNFRNTFGHSMESLTKEVTEIYSNHL